MQLSVIERPRITLLTTGDELRDAATPTAELEPQQIRNSNGPMLAAFFEALGAPLIAHVHVPDEPEQTLAAAREALAHSHLVVTVGGISAGERDFLPRVWEQLGLHTLLHGVAIQPGRPLFVATPSTEEAPDNKLVIGLPGNPVSALLCAHLFVRAVVAGRHEGTGARRHEGGAGEVGSRKSEVGGEKAEGLGPGAEGQKESAHSSPGPKARGPWPCVLPWREVTLASDVRANARRELFRAARVIGDGLVEPIEWHGSGDLVHLAAAEGVVRLPVQEGTVAAGTTVPYLPLVIGQ